MTGKMDANKIIQSLKDAVKLSKIDQMPFYVIEYYKGQPIDCVLICDTVLEAENYIDNRFDNDPGVDYKTTFTIEKRNN